MPQISSARPQGTEAAFLPVRLLFLFCLIGLSGGCNVMAPHYDYTAPAVPEGFLLVDTYAGIRAYDWINVENRLSDRIDVAVLVHDVRQGRWRSFASAFVPAYKRIELEPSPKARLKENRYYAVRVSGVAFQCLSHDVRHNDLYLYVGDACEACQQYVDGMASARRSEPRAQPSPAAVSVPAETDKGSFAGYEIVQCERETGSGFAYRFELKILGDRSLRAFRNVQREFRAAIKEDYAESFSGTRMESLYVDFPEYRQQNDRIMGRAVVLTLTVIRLDYDPGTRKGVMSVRIGANQFEEARKWIRKNIETLARDKNVALYTGELPAAAKFYLGREAIKDGNVLEIEFETE